VCTKIGLTGSNRYAGEETVGRTDQDIYAVFFGEFIETAGYNVGALTGRQLVIDRRNQPTSNHFGPDHNLALS
jgi:hypothetical protein